MQGIDFMGHSLPISILHKSLFNYDGNLSLTTILYLTLP